MKTMSSKFTLIELLVVIGVIAILITMLLPALKKAKITSQRIACVNNERQLYLAYQSYLNDSDEYLPMMYNWFWSDPAPTPLKRWTEVMFDYLKPAFFVYSTYGYRIKDNSFLSCPAMPQINYYERRITSPNYGMLKWGIGGGVVNSGRPYKRFSDVREPSNQVAFGDSINTNNPGLQPPPGNFYIDQLYYHDFRHNNRSNYIFCDGHVDNKDRSFVNPPLGWWTKTPWGNP